MVHRPCRWAHEMELTAAHGLLNGSPLPQGNRTRRALQDKGPRGARGGGGGDQGGRSTATSALGALLSTGNHHAIASQGNVPSNTSRYFSFDFGLIHFVALDLNMYYGTDPCGDPCRLAQMDWQVPKHSVTNDGRGRCPRCLVVRVPTRAEGPHGGASHVWSRANGSGLTAAHS